MSMNWPQRAETRTISIDAAPSDVLAFVADPHNLPRWAPAFADTVRADGDDWIVAGDDRQARITVRVSTGHGTVDLLDATDLTRGAFTRVLPNGPGSEYLFTLVFPAGTDEAAIARQMDTVDDELRAVRALCERRPDRG